MNLYTRSDLRRFEQRVEDKIDSILDDLGTTQHERDRSAHRLDRLRDASAFLRLFQRQVKTDAQVIELDSATACTLYDYYLTDKDAR